jgi:hypothetical protein
MATRNEVLQAVGSRYRAVGRAERSLILDEFVQLTGYHRKHAIRLLREAPKPYRGRRGRRPTYGDEVRSALLALWNLSDRLCSKRLKQMIPLLLPAAIRHGVIDDREGLGALLLRISPATIDRVLSEDRIAAQAGRRRRAGMSSAIRRDVPVHTFNDWDDPAPGFAEADFVAHGGTSVAGSFIQTLVLTDVATGWTECVPVVTRSAPLVIEAIRSAMALFPFSLKGIDFDNDSAFMNEHVVPWCRAKGLIVTRSRAYKKNDQAWVEQKNGAIVRRLVGYGRLEGIDTLRCLNRLYSAVRLHVNLCQPSFKLKSKKRIGARVHKTWDDPKTPAARLLARADVCSTVREKLAALQASVDPVELIRLIRLAQGELGERVDRRGMIPAKGPSETPTDGALPSAVSVAQARKPENLHKRAYRRTKPVAKKRSRLDPVAAEVRVWLSLDPAMTAAAIHTRLTALHGPLVGVRSVQQLVKKIRLELLKHEITAAAQPLEEVA